MKKILTTAIPLAVSALSIAALCSGCGGYVPPEGSNYFYKDGVCRVITLEETKTVEQKAVSLQVLINPRLINTDIVTVTTDLKHAQFYNNNSIFFKDCEALNKEGIEVVYKCLGVYDYSLNNNASKLLLTDFFSFNETVKYNAYLSNIVVNSFPEGKTLCEVADVTVYSFNYEDYTSDGRISASGSFEIYVNSFTYVDMVDYDTESLY